MEIAKRIYQHLKVMLLAFLIVFLIVLEISGYPIQSRIDEIRSSEWFLAIPEYLKGIILTFLHFLGHFPLIVLGFILLELWHKINSSLLEIQKNIGIIRERNYPLAFANLVRKLEPKEIFKVNQIINPAGTEGEIEIKGPIRKLYACDINSPYDWLTNDILAYDAIFRSWLRNNGDRRLNRILLWPQKDFLSEIALKVIEIQWMNAYHLFIFFTEDIHKANAQLFPGRVIDTSKLNFLVWDIEMEETELKGSNDPDRTAGTLCYGYWGEKNRDGIQPEYCMRFLSLEDRNIYAGLWKHLKSSAVAVEDLIGNHPVFKGKSKPIPGEFFEPGLGGILKEQLEKLVKEKHA